MDMAERVRRRLREEMDRRDLSQQDVADLITWTQSKVAQKLTGRTPITLDELEALCFGVSITPVEAVRDHGLEFVADLTPTELRLLQRLRQLPRHELDAVMTLIHLKPQTSAPERHAGPLKKRKATARS
jgi:transcriptional regulator with XRE-family HTH domain